MTNEDGTEATVDSPENLEALTFVQKLMEDGVAAYSSDLGAGWGGEAFGKQLAAMTIEGSWIGGAMSADFPDVDYTVAELPQGPAGTGTLAFTNCWGIAEASGNKEDAVDAGRVADQRGPAARVRRRLRRDPVGRVGRRAVPAGPPGLRSRSSPAPTTRRTRPSQQGAADVISDFNAQLEGLKNGDPAAILASVQAAMQAALEADRPVSRGATTINRGRTRDGWLFVSPAVAGARAVPALPVLMAALGQRVRLARQRAARCRRTSGSSASTTTGRS